MDVQQLCAVLNACMSADGPTRAAGEAALAQVAISGTQGSTLET